MNLREIRKRKHLTLKQVAALLNISESAVCLYEQGKRTPNIETAFRLSVALDCTIDELISKADQNKLAAADSEGEQRVIPPLS